MNQEKINAVKKMMMDSDGRLGYAYLYPLDGGERKEFLFEMTPENIANFIGFHQWDTEKMILTDMLDRLLLETTGGFIFDCPDQNLCREIISFLAPIQMGEREAKPFPIISNDDYEEYCRLEDVEVTAAELGMQL